MLTDSLFEFQIADGVFILNKLCLEILKLVAGLRFLQGC